MPPLKPIVSDQPSGKRDVPLLRGSTILAGRGAPKGPQKTATCFQCGHPNSVPQMATSSQCKECGSYIHLDNIVLKPGTRRRFIQTHGDVTVLSQTILDGMWVRCRNLQVDGIINGTLEVQGSLTFEKSCRISANVSAGAILIPRGVQIEFQAGLSCSSLVLEGHLLGPKIQTTEIRLGKSAMVLADIQTARITREPGSIHRGHLEISRSSPPGENF